MLQLWNDVLSTTFNICLPAQHQPIPCGDRYSPSVNHRQLSDREDHWELAKKLEHLKSSIPLTVKHSPFVSFHFDLSLCVNLGETTALRFIIVEGGGNHLTYGEPINGPERPPERSKREAGSAAVCGGV